MKKKPPSPCSSPDHTPGSMEGRGTLGCSTRDSLMQPPRCCPPHPFLSHLGASPRAHYPPCHPSQEPMALLHAPAALCPAPPARSGRFSGIPGRHPLPAAGCAPQTLHGGRALSPSTCLPSTAAGGKLEDENIRGRWDLRPRNCLAQFVLYKGGEYPREHSAHDFPCS